MQDNEYQVNGAWTNSDKMAQIPNMDIIYGASLFTIIAACGVDSNAGLPGVQGSGTRQMQAFGNIGNQLYLEIQHDPTASLWESQWLKRAWTFQEFVLSKRHMIFLPEQVVFHCHTVSWCEDHFMEPLGNPKDMTRFPTWTRSLKITSLQMPDRSKWSNDVYFPAIFINHYLMEWIRNFLQRRLTVSSDILFAFDGALSVCRQYLGSFHYGLPIDFFTETIGWSIGSVKTIDTSLIVGLIERRPGFPSWSWAGWVWNGPKNEHFHLYYQGKHQKQWRRIAIWGVKASNSGQMELWPLSHADLDRWRTLDCLPTAAFEVGEQHEDGELGIALAKIRTIPRSLECIVLRTLTSFVFVHLAYRTSHTAALAVYAQQNLTEDNAVGMVHLNTIWQDQAEAGLRLQILITGSYFRGPDTRFPDQTDEHNPTICCLVVEEVGDGVFERQAPLSVSYENAQKLEWTPSTAILR
ncbi:hypothetical protein ACN47E_002480 [Coniothyrium glycines]